MLDPVRRTGDGALPQAVILVTVGLRAMRREDPVTAAQRAHLIEPAPQPAAQPRECRRAEGGRLDHGGPVDGNLQEVGLHLHEQI